MDTNEIPKELQKALAEALHNIAMFMHEQGKKSIAVLHVAHVSDCLEQQSRTEVVGATTGDGVERRPGGAPIEGNPAELAEELLKQMLKPKAK